MVNLLTEAACKRQLDGVFFVNDGKWKLVHDEILKSVKHFVVFASNQDALADYDLVQYSETNAPVKVIQWSAIEYDGSDLDIEIDGVYQQRISSCLQELDSLLNASAKFVTCRVLVEKVTAGKKDLTGTIMNIMGIRDIKSISMDTRLTDIGMDSLMSVEVQQMLERNFEIALSVQEMNNLTLGRLNEFSGGNEKK